MNNVLFGDDRYQYYETVCGGVGAGPGFAGWGPVQTHMTNTRMTDPEILELRYPVRLEEFAIRRGSGGGGEWRGGDGARRRIRFLRPMQAVVVRAAVDLLPPHLRVQLGLSGRGRLTTPERLLLRALARTADRAVFPTGPAAQACLRLGLPADYLLRNRRGASPDDRAWTKGARVPN